MTDQLKHRVLRNGFWEKFLKSGDCWVWQYAKDGRGYGNLGVYQGGKYHNLKAHRVSYELSGGVIGINEVVMHLCDNPSCINPEHLRAASQADNMRDMLSKNRNRHTRGEDRPNAKFTNSEAQSIRDEKLTTKQTNRQLAQKYCVSNSTISDIITGKRYR